MKLFPHILARVGGCTFSKVEALSFGKMTFVNVLLKKESNLEFQFEKVLQNFQRTAENTEDYRLIAILKNGKKDFENHRFSFFKKLQKIDQKEFLSDLLFDISIYFDWKLEYKKLKNEFDLLFQKEEIFQYLYLRDFFQNENMQKGLLQSSHSLFLQNQKLVLKSPKNYRKKERQTLRALAKYFYRIGGKTSPFSHFTTLDILSKKDGIFKHSGLEIGDDYFQFNNFILVEMKNILLQDPTFFRQLKLRVNPSLVLKDNEFHFLKNTKNIETIQQLEASGILEELLQTIPQEGLKFEIVANKLLVFVEADQESIENYLLELIEIGLIEWQWDFSGLSFNWELMLEEKLLSMDDFSNKGDWLLCLEQMKKSKMQMEIPESDYRYSLLKSLKNDFEKLGINQIIPELIVFEDVQKNTSIELSENEIKPIIQSLDSLLQFLEPLVENEMKNKISQCWDENFKEETSVPLMHFYQKYFQTTFNNNTFKNDNKIRILNSIKSRLKENFEIDQNGDLNFSIKALEYIFPKRQRNSKNSYSGLFQFYKNEEKTKAVINGLTPGYGKLFGRFSPLFDKEITIQLQKWNSKIQNENLWVENVDASIFNANLHPPLLSCEIKNVSSQNNLPLENQIPIKDIEVIWEEDLEEPILIFAKTKMQISIFDFGFEHPENRSPMFQLLNGFSLPHATYRFFLKLVNEVFEEQKPNEFKGCRKVSIDNHLVLQRRSLEVTHSSFPQKEKNESNSSFFLRIQKWKSAHHFSQYIFLKPILDSDNSNSSRNKDFYKPQLFDLHSPVAIVLLQKILEKHLGKFWIEEILPNEEGMVGDSVSEFVVQWRSDG
ncbi:MAG: lantibiotic dehydratase [Saprospiraceae bacterium]